MATTNACSNGLSGTTGTGTYVGATSPTLVTPNIGVATATSVNGATITSTTGTLTLANGSTLATSGANSITLTSTGATNVTLPTSGTLTTSNSTPIAKAWVAFSNNGTAAILDSYNVSSVSRIAGGQVQVNLTVPFANTNYCVVATPSSGAVIVQADSLTVSSFVVFTSGSSSPVDANGFAVAYGAQ